MVWKVNWPLFRFEHKFKAPERNNQNCIVLTSDDVDGHRELLAIIELREAERHNRGLWRHICCVMKENGFEEDHIILTLLTFQSYKG
jgi:general stress protein 26